MARGIEETTRPSSRMLARFGGDGGWVFCAAAAAAAAVAAPEEEKNGTRQVRGFQDDDDDDDDDEGDGLFAGGFEAGFGAAVVAAAARACDSHTSRDLWSTGQDSGDFLLMLLLWSTGHASRGLWWSTGHAAAAPLSSPAAMGVRRGGPRWVRSSVARGGNRAVAIREGGWAQWPWSEVRLGYKLDREYINVGFRQA